jgi:malate dehydrogenase (oxaloacetate-decarboxylating)(NADP+)
VLLVDSKGVIHAGREDMDPGHPRYNEYKAYFAQETDARELADAMRGADAFAGVSVKDLVTQEMVKSMASDPIVFAMANPDPEITYPAATEARSDVIMATGRSDYPNQVNNVLGFPFIFRGALDVRARAINEKMKVAAAQALAALAKEDVPDEVLRAYHLDKLQFGREYLIPKPFDPRVLTWEAVAVAKAAVDSGVARKPIDNWDAYRDHLESFLGAERETMRRLVHRAQRRPKRIVFGEGDDPKVLRAAQMIVDEAIARPVLLAEPEAVAAKKRELGLELEGVEVIEPADSDLYEQFVSRYYELRQRRGVNREEAYRDMSRRSYFGPMMVREGEADVFVSGRSRYYPIAIRPMLQVMSDRIKGRTVCAAHIAIKNNRHFILADTSVNIDPTVEQLVSIAESTHELARTIGIVPRIALLSFASFGSVRSSSTDRMRQAVELLWEKHPDWAVDGELQADTAVVSELLQATYPFAKVRGGANCLIFPSLDAANIAFRLLHAIGDVSLVGPVLMGLSAPMYVLQRGATPEDIVHIAALGAVRADELG